MNNSNKWLSNRWAFFIGVGIVLIIFVVIPFLFPGGRSVASIIGEICAAIIVILALIIFVFRLVRK